MFYHASSVHVVYAVIVPVCASVISRYSTTMADCRITLTKPHSSPGTLVIFLVPNALMKFKQGHSKREHHIQVK